MCFSLFTPLYTKSDTLYNYTYPIIILYLCINFASVPKLYFIFDGFEKYTQRVPKSSINEVILVTFHKQEQMHVQNFGGGGWQAVSFRDGMTVMEKRKFW